MNVVASLRSFGIASLFCWRVLLKVLNGRVLTFIGETVRQAGILITGSAIIVLGLVFIFGLQCGIEGAYGAKSVGATSAAGGDAADDARERGFQDLPVPLRAPAEDGEAALAAEHRHP